MKSRSGPNTKLKRTAVATIEHASSLDTTVKTPIELNNESVVIQGVPDNKIWDDLLEKYGFCAQLLLTPKTLLPLLNNQKLMSCIDNRPNADRIGGIVARDLVKFSTYLQRIHSRHSERRGGTMDPNELMLANILYTEYVSFAEQFNANVVPMIISLTEILAIAEQKLVATDKDAMVETQKQFDDIATNVVGVRMVDRTGENASEESAVQTH